MSQMKMSSFIKNVQFAYDNGKGPIGFLCVCARWERQRLQERNVSERTKGSYQKLEQKLKAKIGAAIFPCNTVGGYLNWNRELFENDPVLGEYDEETEWPTNKAQIAFRTRLLEKLLAEAITAESLEKKEKYLKASKGS